ncbi:MAG: glutathione peroxidase [Bacteroidia bacterium]|nr:glutathione peroxidase [Bacteroidia bacterium]
MKALVIGLLIAAAGFVFYSFKFKSYKLDPSVHPAAKSFYDLSITGIDGKTISFADLKGKKVLCVNVASECGYTPQYTDLENLHRKYKDKLVLIGFPCNQFGGQEPGTNEAIQNFCKKNYGVSFLLTDKIEVKGNNQHPVYQWLTQKALNGKGDYEVKWNFNKFLISEKGELIQYFPSAVKPFDQTLISLIEK